MRRRRNAKKIVDDYSIDEDEDEDSLDEGYVKEKRAKKKGGKGPRNNPKKSKKKMNQEYSDNSVNSEVIQFKGRDQIMREHRRPSFIQRWNGQDNQIEIFAEEYKEMSPMFKVYWETKSKNMNVVVFMQFGRVEFFTFQNDAILCHQLFKKKLKVFSSFMMVNFWNKQVILAKQELFERSIPVMVMNEIDDPAYREKNNLIRRQIDEVITPGLHLSMDQNAYKERWFMSFYIQEKIVLIKKAAKSTRRLKKVSEKPEPQPLDSPQSLKKCCVVLLDSESNKFFIQEFEVDQKLHQVRRVLNRYRPVELLTMKTSSEYVKRVKQMAKQICNPFQVEISYENQQENVSHTLKQFMKGCKASMFRQMMSLAAEENKFDGQFSMFCAVRCLDLLRAYLENLKLKQKIFDEGIFSLERFNKAKMKPFFDSQVYENLEIFRIKNQDESMGEKGTMINYLNKCKTNSGKKLLIKWLNEPLTTKEAIKERQDCFQSIVEHTQFSSMIALHEKLVAYQNLEKEVADVYHWVLRNKHSKAYYLTGDMTFEKGYDQSKNPAIQRIKVILKILKKLSQFQTFLKDLKQFNLKSKYIQRFISLVSLNKKQLQKIEETEKNSNQIPDISNLIETIVKKVDYNEVTNYLEPQKGVNPQYDKEKQAIIDLNDKLQSELQKWKKHFSNNKITFAHVRARNEIQIPKTCIGSRKQKPKQLIFSSEIAHSERFTTAKTIEISEELMEREHRLAKAYEPFMNEIIKDFCQHKFIWNQYISAISEIDVILSLAETSKRMMPRCIPQFCEDDENSELSIVEGNNIALMQIMDPQDLVSNTLKMTKNGRFLLLTGPNMGGKSTVLKQTCLLAILAQIGFYVPCKSYKSIVFDQIFCRIGASDRIVEGKSTFYVQLEETNRILRQATPSSLVIIDELGRGTSTYDGMAIAEATIKHTLNKIGCYTLFSTHYTPITKQFANFPEVICMKMSYQIKVNKDKEPQKQQKLRFLYQLQKGVAEKSFANNVARIVGLPESILSQANEKAEEILKSHEKVEAKSHLRRVLEEMEEKGYLQEN